MPKLTKTLVDYAKAPEKGDAYIWDAELPGFGIRIQSSGRKTYVIRYRTKGSSAHAPVQRKMTLARCSDMAPDKARDMARKVFAQVAEGRDPVSERKHEETVAAGTVEKMFTGYVASLRARGCASAAEVERALLKARDNAADALGRDTPAADVTPTDIVNYIAPFFQRGHRGAANKHRSYIASAYAWAIKSANDYTVPADQRIEWGIIRNPAADVARDAGAHKIRDRNLSSEELRMLWLATEPGAPGFWPETAACIRMLICCGQRVQETLRIEGKDINLKEKVWEMPAHKTKGKKAKHVVPLPDQAVEVLAPLIDAYGDGPLFPSRDDEGILSHTSIMQAIGRWYATAGVEPFQTRDLRRTWKSRAHDAGIDRFTRDLLQQHSKGDTGSKVYDRAEYFPQMREAMDKWGKWLAALINGEQMKEAA